jgi:hypothetical protein
LTRAFLKPAPAKTLEKAEQLFLTNAYSAIDRIAGGKIETLIMIKKFLIIINLVAANQKLNGLGNSI